MDDLLFQEVLQDDLVEFDFELAELVVVEPFEDLDGQLVLLHQLADELAYIVLFAEGVVLEQLELVPERILELLLHAPLMRDQVLPQQSVVRVVHFLVATQLQDYHCQFEPLLLQEPQLDQVLGGFEHVV